MSPEYIVWFYSPLNGDKLYISAAGALSSSKEHARSFATKDLACVTASRELPALYDKPHVQAPGKIYVEMVLEPKVYKKQLSIVYVEE